MKRITSPDNPFFKTLAKLSNSARQRSKSGLTLLDGAHLLTSYLALGKLPQHIVVTENALHDAEIKLLLEKASSVPLILMDNSLFAELSELKSLSAVMALVEVIAQDADPMNNHFCVLLENIQDPGNLGSILRSAAAAGCDAVFLSKGCADAWSPKVLRAAMGGHFVLNIYEDVDLIKIARLFPGTVFSAALSSKTSLYDSCLNGKIALAIGNEGAGLTEDLLAISRTFRIPMPGKVESLNAAAAAAVCLFEAVRQRI